MLSAGASAYTHTAQEADEEKEAMSNEFLAANTIVERIFEKYGTGRDYGREPKMATVRAEERPELIREIIAIIATADGDVLRQIHKAASNGNCVHCDSVAKLIEDLLGIGGGERRRE